MDSGEVAEVTTNQTCRSENSYLAILRKVAGRATPSDQAVPRALKCTNCGGLFEPRPSGCPGVADERQCRACNSPVI
jgi:hypothetical protein